ncbi:MAG: hypothetical protein H0V25_11645 [Solirubrobacterales bacterium]|nr:hypothetical protein [Solirubrobacterales bacterium]
MTQIMLLVNQQPPTRAGRQRAEHLRALRSPRQRGIAAEEPIAIRLLGEGDRPALDRLAGLDSATVPSGRVLGAEVGGRLLAARSLLNGGTVADPFRPTSAAIEILRLRARQLGGEGAPGRRLWRRGRLGRRHSRGALAGSPPGAGGRLLQL